MALLSKALIEGKDWTTSQMRQRTSQAHDYLQHALDRLSQTSHGYPTFDRLSRRSIGLSIDDCKVCVANFRGFEEICETDDWEGEDNSAEDARLVKAQRVRYN